LKAGSYLSTDSGIVSALADFIRADRKESSVKEHIILGTDSKDAERQMDLWLAQHPRIRVLRVHRPRPEQHLLALIGGRHAPRVSITVDYEESDVGAA
jgi:hypothetical protein